MEKHVINATTRTVLGKKVESLRSQGFTPAHLYGPGIASQSLQVETQELVGIINVAGGHTPILLSIDGQDDQVTVFIRETQIHPINENVLHVDLYQVDVAKKIAVSVPVRIEGEAPAVKKLGGSIFQGMHQLKLECIPIEIPEYITVDVGELDAFDKAIRVRDLVLSSNIAVKDDQNDIVVRVAPPKAVEEVAVAEEEVPKGESEDEDSQEGRDEEEVNTE